MKVMIHVALTVLFTIVVSIAVTAQSTIMYWQQEVNYNIRVSLNDTDHFLNGDISIEYINHSPDTLQYIWFHLWPNAYKNTETAFAIQQVENGSTEFHFSGEEDKGYIDQLDFRINGSIATTQEHPEYGDITKLVLNEPLLPEHSITITAPFRVKIPKTFSRLGHIGQSYQITQWYPKPAVYDRYGWHPMPYLDQGEFYSEFGSFNVSITLPENYVVGATGTLLNEGEKKWLDSLAAATKKKFENDSAIRHVPVAQQLREQNKENNFPPSSSRLKTLQYVAGNVHDFAWFADKRYHVMKSHVQLSNKDKIITTWAMFLDRHAHLWKNVIQFVDSSVIYYSKWIGDYPYPQATAVEGALQAGDGMEYPMITVVSGDLGGKKSLETVVAHEVGHNWFYGILGFNEREHPWMDEGINSYYENRYIEKRYPSEGLVPDVEAVTKTFDLSSYSRGYQNYLFYIFQAYCHLDQPMDINATDFTFINYGAIVYSKTALVWEYLTTFLGTETYDSLMHQFYNEWSFKHPYPEDVKNFFEVNTNKELDWFFHQTIETKDYLDYKLVKAKDTAVIGNSVYQKLTIANKADIKGPYSIAAIKDGKVVNTLWYGGFEGKMEVLFPQGDYDAFRIDEGMVLPETNRQNNMVAFRSPYNLPNMEKIRLQWLGSLDNPERTQLFFTPTLGWNNYDKFWLGLALYNSVLPGKPVSIVLMPAYGFGSNSLVGLGEVNLQLFPKTSFIHRIDITSSAKTFDYANNSYFGYVGDYTYRFMKFTQQIRLGIRKSTDRSPVNQSLTFRNIFVRQEVLEMYSDGYYHEHQLCNQLSYAFLNKRVLNPFRFSISLEQGSSAGEDFYLKTFLDGNYTITYPRKKHGIDLRFFTGVMLAAPDEGTFTNFHLGPTTGIKDYRFDEVYLGRTESTGFLSQQVAVEEGGFKMRTDGVQPELGQSDSWLLALNAKVPLPFFSPIFVFGDAGLAPNDNNYQDFQFDAGIGITLIPEIVEVYLPLIFSNDMKLNLNSTDFYDTWYKRISFTLNINQLNPFKAIRTISL